MNLPFTKSEFLDVFTRYNESVWPASFVLAGLAALAVVSLVRQWRYRDRLASGVLGLLWLWSGLVYHLFFFAQINPAAIAFGILFVVQALGFFRWGVRRHGIVFAPHTGGARAVIGVLLITYAMVIYPTLGIAFKHGWPNGPTFGAPCPVVLFTFGVLFWADSTLPKSLLVLPLGWAFLGTSAAIEFGIYEDWGLIVAGILATLLLLARRRAPTRPLAHVAVRKHPAHPVG